MKSTSANIYVFSGAGNTFILARAIANIFNSNNLPTTLHPIPGRVINNEPNIAIGFAFTTAYFSTYPFVIDFLENLPEGKGQEVFLISSMAGSSFGMPEPIRKLLLAKNYLPIGSHIFKMPTNYGKNQSSDSATNQALIKTSIVKAENFAGHLLAGKSIWKKQTAPLASLFYRWVKGSYPWKFFRFIFPLQINQKLCIKCQFCKSICPTNAIETLPDNTLNITEKCVSCQHCAAFCPQNAIHLKNHTAPTYNSVEYSEISSLLIK